MTDRKPRGDMQARILAYIEQEIRTRGYAPSVREIGEAVGLKSTSTVHGHLTRMEKKGLLRRDAMKPRAIGLSAAFSPFDENASLREIPVVGRVAAGTPILAEENIEETMTLGGNGWKRRTVHFARSRGKHDSSRHYERRLYRRSQADECQ